MIRDKILPVPRRFKTLHGGKTKKTFEKRLARTWGVEGTQDWPRTWLHTFTTPTGESKSHSDLLSLRLYAKEVCVIDLRCANNTGPHRRTSIDISS